MKRFLVRLEVGATSCVMLAILFSIGWVGISHLRELNRRMQYVIGKCSSNEQMVAEAFHLSNLNNHITLSVFLMDDRDAINRLLVQRADNTRRISELILDIKARPGTEEEKRLLAALESARKPYVESYGQSLKKLVDEHQFDEARKEMVSVTLPLLAIYHAAWDAFAQYEHDEMEQAIKQSQADFVVLQRQLLFYLILACVIAIFVTIRVTQLVAQRQSADENLRQLNNQLEQRVQQRTAELVRTNQSLQVEISERQRSENELRKFSHAVGQSPASVVITDLQGGIEYVNPMFCAVTGYSFEEVRGKNPRVLKSGDMPAAVYRQLWADLTAGKDWHGEFHNRRKNGELYWETASIAPVRDAQGKITHFIAIKEDITERKRMEAALREREEQLLLFVKHSPAAIAMLDLDMKYLVVSRRWMQDYRLGDQAILGRSHYDVFPEIPPRWREIHQRCLAGAVEKCQEEAFPRADGTIDWLRWEIQPWHQADGAIGGIIIFSEVITQRKQAESLVRQSEERYRNVVDTARDAIFTIAADGTFASLNPATETIGGISRAEWIGRPFAPLVHPDDLRLAEEMFQRVLNGKPAPVHELRGHPTLPQPAVLEMTLAAHKDETGKIIGVQGIGRDITGRRQAEELLRQSEARFRNYFELGVVGMAISSPAKGCLEVNDQICQILGYERGELLHMSWADFTHPDDRAAEFAVFNRLLAGQCEGYSMDKRFIRKDGRIVYATISVKCVRRADGSVDYMMGVLLDITERKQTEAALRDSEEKFRQLADNITDVFWMTSPDLNTILYISPGYELIWGRSCESLQANPHQWLEAILPEERGRVYTVFATLMDTAPTVGIEYQIARPDGTVRWIHDRGFQVRDAAGKLVRLAGIASDITGRKRAAQELAEHRENEERVRLELEHEQALNRVKSHFVSLVSHEFRTPLSVISMGAFMLRDYSEGMSPEERAGHIQEIQLAVGRMTGMMEDFLVHEKIQCGKMACHPARMKLEAFCRGLIAEVVNHFQPGRQIELTFDPAAREVALDEKILRHILCNLLNNAVKYSDAGQPVRLEVKRVAGHPWTADVPQTPTEDQVQLTVSDSGIGIPAADLTKIYDTFHRAANVGNRPGTGMGLAIVKQFVDLHRGVIRLESQEGKGTTVRVWLPLGPESVGAAKAGGGND